MIVFDVNTSPLHNQRSSGSCLLTLANLFTAGVDRHDCVSPGFSVLYELWIELVFFQVSYHFTLCSVHPSQSGPSSMSLPSHLRDCISFATFLTSLLITCMAIQQKVFLGVVCDDWLDHCITSGSRVLS